MKSLNASVLAGTKAGASRVRQNEDCSGNEFRVGGKLIRASAKNCLVRYNEIHILSQVCCQPAGGLATFSQGDIVTKKSGSFQRVDFKLVVLFAKLCK